MDRKKRRRTTSLPRLRVAFGEMEGEDSHARGKQATMREMRENEMKMKIMCPLGRPTIVPKDKGGSVSKKWIKVPFPQDPWDKCIPER